MQKNIFEFELGTKIIFGIGCLSKLRDELKNLQVKNPLIVTDNGIVETGLLDQVTKVLKSTGMVLNVFDEVESNPSAETVEKGLGLFRDKECDATIGVGGGSSMDVAKAIALRAKNVGLILDYLQGKRKIEKSLPPVVTIPTTAGTGSEVTSGIVIKDNETKNKLYFGHEWIRPKLAIVDPLMTVNLPPKLTAGTGADALSHAVESYMGVNSNPISEIFSLRAIELVNDNLREAVLNGKSLEIRSNMALAATFAGITLSWGIILNHEMTSLVGGAYNIHHGMLCGIMLPHAMEYSLHATVKKLANIARAMRCRIEGLTEIEAARMAIKTIKKLFADVGIPKTLSELGVGKDLFSKWADIIISNEYVMSNTVPRASKADIIQLFENAF